MFLRKFVSDLRTQNWSSVILELAIVVLGVFIGIQANLWKETRNERIEGQQLLELIHSDLLTTISSSEGAIQWSLGQRSRTQIILNSLRAASANQENRDAIGRGLFFLGFSPPLTDNIVTLRAMQEAGKFGLITDPKMRTQLAAYLSSFESTNEVIRQLNETVRASVNDLRSYYGASIALAINNEGDRPLDGKGEELPRESVEVDFDALLADPDARFAVMNIRATMANAILTRRQHLRLAVALAEQIAAALS